MTRFTVTERCTPYGSTYDVRADGVVCRADVGSDLAYRLAEQFAADETAWIEHEIACGRPAVAPDCTNAVQ